MLRLLLDVSKITKNGLKNDFFTLNPCIFQIFVVILQRQR